MSDEQASVYYRDFLKKKAKLDNLIMRQLQILAELDLKARQQEVEKLLERLRTDSFKVLIMGEFKRGKSTLINALLREKVLPAFAKPTTAIINEIKLGQEPRAVLHYLPTPDGLVKKPMEIPVDKIGEYVIIKNIKSGAVGSTMYESPYEKVELFWDLDLCREGVEIIDSPGLNEDIGRQKITLEYLKSVDVVLFAVACDFPVSMSELGFVQVLKDAGHECIFFICNRINMIEEEEKQDVKDRCIALLAPYTKEGKKHVIFVDARGALTGWTKKDQEQIRASNIQEVEEKLKNFLANERGRIKLLPPVHRMRAAIREAWNTLPTMEKLCHVDLEELQARYARTESQLRQLEYERKQIYGQLVNFRTEIGRSIERLAIKFYANVAQEIGQWTEEYQLQHSGGLRVPFSGKAREQVAAEVTAFLTERVRQEFELWKSTIMAPHLTSQWDAELQKLDERTKTFTKNLEQIRLDLVAGIPGTIFWERTSKEEVSTLERILAASGVLVGDVSSLSRGSTFGLKETIKTIIPQLALAVVTGIAVAWNPIILIPVVLASGGLQALLRAQPISKKIRDMVGQEYARHLEENRYPLASRLADIVDQQFLNIQNALDTELMLQVQNIRDQINAIINLKQQEEGKVQQKQQTLNAIARRLNEIDNEVDELIEQVVLGRDSSQ